mgnify:FL=1
MNEDAHVLSLPSGVRTGLAGAYDVADETRPAVLVLLAVELTAQTEDAVVPAAAEGRTNFLFGVVVGAALAATMARDAKETAAVRPVRDRPVVEAARSCVTRAASGATCGRASRSATAACRARFVVGTAGL